MSQTKIILDDWFTDIPNNADFYSHENQKFWVLVYETFNFKTNKPIVFLPCASKKPISNSRTHCYLSPITRDERFEKIIISEPQTVIPYTLEKFCPNYDYPPGKLNERDRWQLIRRLGLFLAKLRDENQEIQRLYYIGAIHHLKILLKANKIIDDHFSIISIIPERGFMDYNSDARKLQNIIVKQENLK